MNPAQKFELSKELREQVRILIDANEELRAELFSAQQSALSEGVRSGKLEAELATLRQENDRLMSNDQNWRGLAVELNTEVEVLRPAAEALKTAVELGISIIPYPIYQPEKHSVITKQRRMSDTLREPNPTETMELYNSDPLAATIKAINAAAEQVKEKKL